MGTALDEARARLAAAQAEVEQLERDVPRTGADVARMMREAWPGPEWKADDACPITRARGRWAELFVSYEDDSNPPHWFVSCDAPSAGDYGENNGEIAADFPAAVSALRAAHARLLADLRALAPEGDAPADWREDVKRAALANTLELAKVHRELDTARADVARLREAEEGYHRRAQTDAAEVERLTRERDEAQESADTASGALDEYHARAESAERARDKAADVAREALAIATALISRFGCGKPGCPTLAELRVQTPWLTLAADDARVRDLAASLAALASPAPAPDPLAGLPEEVVERVPAAMDWGSFPVDVECDSGAVWTMQRVGNRTVRICRPDRLLRVAPDGAITREPQP